MSAELLFLLSVFIVSALYASVGHGGASGYLALMVLFGIAPREMKTSALMLNLVVSAIAFIQYYRSGFFKSRLLIPFVILSIPMSYIGAGFALQDSAYRVILACCLVLATLRIAGFPGAQKDVAIRKIQFLPSLAAGAVIGLLSGMIGIGGGILLSPFILLMRYADMKQTAAVSAAFIFVNSAAGLAGSEFDRPGFLSDIIPWVAVAAAGGIIGSWAGTKKLNPVALKYVLCAVMLFAIVKLVFA